MISSIARVAKIKEFQFEFGLYVYILLQSQQEIFCYIILYTVFGNISPRSWRIHESSILYLLVDVFVLIEWECSWQTNVDDHADWPHVKGTIVALYIIKMTEMTEYAVEILHKEVDDILTCFLNTSGAR